MGVGIAGLCKAAVGKSGIDGERSMVIRMRRNTGRKGKFIWMAVAAVLMCGCGQTEDSGAVMVQSGSVEASAGQEDNGGSGEKAAEAKSVEDIYSEIEQGVELISPVKMGDGFITNYYGIEPEKLEEYVFAMSEEATSAETVVIMKVKDEADVENMCAALQVVVDEKRSEMENYLPEQFAIVDKSSVKSKGNYVYLVISEQADAILQVIEKDI